MSVVKFAFSKNKICFLCFERLSHFAGNNLRKPICIKVTSLASESTITFAIPQKINQSLLEQRNSAEALLIKRETDPVIDMCAAVLFMDTATGLRMGKANDIPRNPRHFLYHLYFEHMDANGLTKPLSVQNLSKAVKAAVVEYGKVYLTRQIKGRTQTNVELTDRINDFLPFAYENED